MSEDSDRSEKGLVILVVVVATVALYSVGLPYIAGIGVFIGLALLVS